MKTLFVKNLTNESKDWGTGRTFDANETYEVPSNKWTLYSENSTFIDVLNSEAQVGNASDNFFSDLNYQINYLKNDLPVEVKQTTPKNEHSLKPQGRFKKVITANNQSCSITLSNEQDYTYDYSASLSIQTGAVIVNSDNTVQAEVVSSTDTTVTLSSAIGTGTFTLCNPYSITYEIAGTLGNYRYIWGLFISASNFSDDDWIVLRIKDVDNILGYGSNVVVKAYDDCWTEQVNKLTQVMTPDGSPAEILCGLYMEILYYTTLTDSTTIPVRLNYIITEKDG